MSSLITLEEIEEFVKNWGFGWEWDNRKLFDIKILHHTWVRVAECGNDEPLMYLQPNKDGTITARVEGKNLGVYNFREIQGISQFKCSKMNYEDEWDLFINFKTEDELQKLLNILYKCWNKFFNFDFDEGEWVSV